MISSRPRRTDSLEVHKENLSLDLSSIGIDSLDVHDIWADRSFCTNQVATVPAYGRFSARCGPA
jgi:hypothetical protein